MALKMQVPEVFCGTRMSAPLAPSAFHFVGLRGVQNSRVRLLPAAGKAVAAISRKTFVKDAHERKRIRCSSAEPGVDAAGSPAELQLKSKTTMGEILQKGLKNANVSLPYAIVASTVLAFVDPPSFTWFTTRYYAPALGFLMFAVGINLNAKAFLHVMERPAVIAAGYAGQFIVKPILGVLVAYIGVSLLHLPSAIGSGMLLVACVSGAQLSNYATFMVDPSMAPLSIVMTALSTITAVVVTPTLTYLLLGKRLPVNVLGMMASITQIVVVPIAAGLSLNRFLPAVSNLIRPFLPLCSVLVTCCCIGAPLALNIKALKSQFGLIILFPIFIFHTLAFITGYNMTKVLFPSEPDVEGLARTISFETGMQSSLLGLALANSFFEDPLVALPSAISTVLMSLMGFGLTVVWQQQQKHVAQ
ncbi:unnamed protein product [Calypogeia fissa]